MNKSIKKIAVEFVFRMIVLNDPHLPLSALPGDWPGSLARAAFAERYLALSPAANRDISKRLSDQRGQLAVTTDAVKQREQGLIQ